ncbi:MAG: tryptophanyl-tRNA synthetase [Candidatus Levybacteria bacterium]|nr:tryptophanyl-tRNA synthetase [Candidatus Levybacteria bacterium]
MKTVFSGVQPSGNLHIGNYIGALSRWVTIQENAEAIFCIVDLHAITVPQDPKILKEKILEVASLYLACGIDPKKAHIFVQSENPDHANLAWILNCITSFGQLQRMTQFKEKSRKTQSLLDLKNAARREFEMESFSSVGLFDYPVLMAADILLYQTDEVPVGEDQKQHIELTRDLAEKFNKKYGETFKLPVPVIQGETARIMSLQNPVSKMSKSDKDPMGTINLLDSEEQIREKVKRAVTDSSFSVSKNPSEAIANLLTIHAAFENQHLEKSLLRFEGKSYGELKTALANLLVAKLSGIQKKYQEIRADDKVLRKILDEGRDYSKAKSSQTLQVVKEKMGLSA